MVDASISFILVVVIALIVGGIFLVIDYANKKNYESSHYYQETRKPYDTIVHNKGAWGEYQTFSALANVITSSSCILYNLYIPTKDGKITEVDAVLITPQGLFVLENKNFSGWIFGDANQRYWCQTLRSSRGCEKHRFYNPIWQNGGHIRSLRSLLGETVPFYSIVTFSNRCTFKKLNTTGANAYVVYASALPNLVANLQATKPVCLSPTAIATICQTLYPYTHASEQTKLAHHIQVQQKRQEF